MIVFCSRCGKEYQDGNLFCSGCGIGLDAKSQNTEPKVDVDPKKRKKRKKPLYKRVWLWLIVVFVGVPILCAVIDSANSAPTSTWEPYSNTASSESELSSKNESISETPKSPTQQVNASYQSILDDYSAKLRAATPGLIDEYNNEAMHNTDGLMGLAKINNNKIMKLAEILNDGIGKMAEVMLQTGTGKYSEYEEWAGKLQNVYMEEGGKITEAMNTWEPESSSSIESEAETQASETLIEGEGDIGKSHIVIKGMEMAQDYSGEKAVIITYEWTNNDDKAKSFWPELDAKVFQDGIECKSPIIRIDGVGSDGLMTEIQPGKTYTFRVGYTLNNSTPEIEVEVKESFSFSSKPKIIKKIFKLPQ